jgi:DNA-binding FrmR family transcriptional regulator
MNKNALNLLKTSRGQIDAVIRMVEEGRYCVDIINQVLATQALLKKASLKILDDHIRGCVKNSFENGNSNEKIVEVIGLIDTYFK